MEPWLYGSSTGLSSLAIIMGAIFWTVLWGTPGLFEQLLNFVGAHRGSPQPGFHPLHPEREEHDQQRHEDSQPSTHDGRDPLALEIDAPTRGPRHRRDDTDS